jgi:glycerol-3-phosphate dehydrogenase (NAD(P)+)
MRIGVIGGGAWGTALAQVAAQGGETLLWAREPEVVAASTAAHENSLFLPGVPLSRRSARPATSPTSAMRRLAGGHPRAAHALGAGSGARCPKPLLLCSKGIEEASGAIAPPGRARGLPRRRRSMVLSGPTFAHEVAAGLPTAVTLAAEIEAEAERCAPARPPTFRIYLSDDVAGAEVGGAVKNVLAIACGVVEGRGLGQNAARR